jgi:hypothetical protein
VVRILKVATDLSPGMEIEDGSGGLPIDLPADRCTLLVDLHFSRVWLINCREQEEVRHPNNSLMQIRIRQ